MRPRFNASRAKAPAASTTPVAPTAMSDRLAKLRAEDGGEDGDREAEPGQERSAQGRLDPEDPPPAAVILGGHGDAAPRPEPPCTSRSHVLHPWSTTAKYLRVRHLRPETVEDRLLLVAILAPERDGECALPPGHGKGPLPPVPVDRLRLGQTPRPPPVPLETAQEGPEVGQEPDERAAARCRCRAHRPVRGAAAARHAAHVNVSGRTPSQACPPCAMA